MDKYIKVGIGVMILDGNKILLGHRAKDKKIQEEYMRLIVGHYLEENKNRMKHFLKVLNVK